LQLPVGVKLKVGEKNLLALDDIYVAVAAE
jgi:hypothetical protein